MLDEEEHVRSVVVFGAPGQACSTSNTGDRVDADVGYGLPVGPRFVGTPRIALTTSQHGRGYRVGYGLGVLDRGDVNFELGVDAQRRESTMEGGASNGLMGRATLGW